MPWRVWSVVTICLSTTPVGSSPTSWSCVSQAHAIFQQQWDNNRMLGGQNSLSKKHYFVGFCVVNLLQVATFQDWTVWTLNKIKTKLFCSQLCAVEFARVCLFKNVCCDAKEKHPNWKMKDRTQLKSWYCFPILISRVKYISFLGLVSKESHQTGLWHVKNMQHFDYGIL